MTIRWIPVASALMLAFAASCSSDDEEKSESCDPTQRSDCACDPNRADDCPTGYVCRPVGSESFCRPESGLPSCLDPEGMDVFAAEANGALAVSWKVNGDFDHSGGFRVRWGAASGEPTESMEVGPDARQAILKPLENGTSHFVVVEALGSDGATAFTSCEIAAMPHVLDFAGDLLVHESTSGNQSDPDIAANADGSRLYLAWEDEGTVMLATSTDFGQTWSLPAVEVGAGESPALAVRDAVLDDEGNPTTPESVFVAWASGGSVLVAAFDPETGALGAPSTVASGAAPDVAVGADVVHVVFEGGGAIQHARSGDAAASFSAPTSLSDGLSTVHAPAIAVRRSTGAAFVAWDAIEGAGDSNVYVAAADDGQSFGAYVRVDDDAKGANQLNISIAVDEGTGRLSATWEDRRNGADVFFSASAEGQTWLANVDVGVGLSGDQFHPQAAVDVAGNVYVAFQDTTAGQKILFSRFNEQGGFDPPLEPSTRAGAEGISADFPTVATDRFGAVYLAWQENRNGPDTDVFFARAQ